jgi:hypothetical protein
MATATPDEIRTQRKLFIEWSLKRGYTLQQIERAFSAPKNLSLVNAGCAWLAQQEKHRAITT